MSFSNTVKNGQDDIGSLQAHSFYFIFYKNIWLAFNL